MNFFFFLGLITLLSTTFTYRTQRSTWTRLRVAPFTFSVFLGWVAPKETCGMGRERGPLDL